MKRQTGFTLIEVIVTLVLIGILTGVVALFLRGSMESYADTTARAMATDGADLALRRIGRDIRLALPNSVRVNAAGSAMELLLTTAGGRYLSADDGVSGQVLDFVGGNLRFDVVGAMPSLSSRVATGNFVVVNNLGAGYEPANAYSTNPNSSNIARISGITRDPGDGWTVTSLTLASNPFTLQNPKMPSPQMRFQVVEGPVSYVCQADTDGLLTLWRYTGYTINSTLNVPPLGAFTRAMLLKGLSTCAGLFVYDTSAAAQRSGLVLISLDLLPRNDSGAIRVVHQIHVDNTP